MGAKARHVYVPTRQGGKGRKEEGETNKTNQGKGKPTNNNRRWGKVPEGNKGARGKGEGEGEGRKEEMKHVCL